MAFEASHKEIVYILFMVPASNILIYALVVVIDVFYLISGVESASQVFQCMKKQNKQKKKPPLNFRKIFRIVAGMDSANRINKIANSIEIIMIIKFDKSFFYHCFIVLLVVVL